MSYGIIRVEKYKKGSVKGLQIHDQREKDVSHTNKDIDFSKSDMNYDLQNSEQINFTEKVSQRIKELDLKKAVRHDAVVMCQCLITSGHEFFESMSKEKQDQFFKDSYDFLCHRYGKQNIISATVHYDERTPHMHINFVPVTSDGRLCAKDLFKKRDLSLLHDDFYKFNKSRGYNLERGESKEEFQKHLTTEEYKLEKQEQFLKQEQQELKTQQAELKKKEDTIKNAINASESVLKKLGYFNTIETGKTLIGGKITISEGDYDKLSALAKQGVMYHDLKGKYEELAGEHEKLKGKAETSVAEKLKRSREMADLSNKYGDLVDKWNELVGYINHRNLSGDFRNYRHEKEVAQQKEMERENSHGWGDMER